MWKEEYQKLLVFLLEVFGTENKREYFDFVFCILQNFVKAKFL